MAAVLLSGQIGWGGSRDEYGHRTYTLVSRIRTTDTKDGPYTVLNTVGLPKPGDPWVVDNDTDYYAWCRPDAEVKPSYSEDEPGNYWTVTQKFSTKPPDKDKQRCQDNPIEDPLMEAPKITGSFTRYQEEATFDRFGQSITNSAFEQLRGPQNEWDKNRPSVTIEMNVAALDLGLLASMIDTLNNAPLWGLPARRIKLSNAPWERRFHGQCSVYFNIKYEFEVRFDGFDRDLLDEGTKVLNGHWDTATGTWVLDNIAGEPPNPWNPNHFIKAVDPKGNPMKIILDGHGLPSGTTTSISGVSLANLQLLATSAQAASLAAMTAYTAAQSLLEIIESYTGVVGTGLSSATTSAADAGIVLALARAAENAVVRVANIADILESSNAAYNASLAASTAAAAVETAVAGYSDSNIIAAAARASDAADDANSALSALATLAASSAGVGTGTTDMDIAAPGYIHIEKYTESNFLLLGIPLTFV